MKPSNNLWKKSLIMLLFSLSVDTCDHAITEEASVYTKVKKLFNGLFVFCFFLKESSSRKKKLSLLL